MYSVCVWRQWVGNASKSMAMVKTNLALGQTRLAMDKGTVLEPFFTIIEVKLSSELIKESLAMDKTPIRFWRRQTSLAMDKIKLEWLVSNKVLWTWVAFHNWLHVEPTRHTQKLYLSTNCLNFGLRKHFWHLRQN